MPEISTAGIFQVAFIARQMEQTPRAFFQTAFEPISRVCAARHARGGLGCRENEERVRACRTHPTMRATACLIPTATPSSLPWERVRERATSRKACIWAVKVLGRLLQFGECPLPSPPPRGRERIAADSRVAGRLKKNARNINGRNFSGSLYRKADGTNAASVFSDGL